MTKFTTTLTAAVAALMLGGAAFAQVEIIGEGPMFNQDANPVTRVSAPHSPRAKVSIQQVAVGDMPDVQQAATDIQHPARAEVRQQTRDAIAKGQTPSVGDRS